MQKWERETKNEKENKNDKKHPANSNKKIDFKQMRARLAKNPQGRGNT
ncbi:MAG: hypothetical protein IKL20_01800 [Alistipes sp.]|nr:hypothetical protein [Alistipes sp.]